MNNYLLSRGVEKTKKGKQLMKKWMVMLFLVSGFSVGSLLAQAESLIPESDLEKLDAYEDTLAILSFAVVNDSFPENRFAACRNLIKTLVQALKTDHSFSYPFERLQSVSIQYPPDSSFRIFTWQLYVDASDYRYYGAIQMNSRELKLFPLVDRSFQNEGMEQQPLSPEKWYGAVYYNLVETEGPQGKYYLLFGFDGFEFFRKRKLIDVLTFQDGKPVFGAPVFHHPEKKELFMNRLILEYSSETSIRLNYDQAYEMIIFDHLLTMEGRHGEGPTAFPDGSYEGYRLENGVWEYVEKVFHDVQDEAPRPMPILDDRPKDIMGRKN